MNRLPRFLTITIFTIFSFGMAQPASAADYGTAGMKGAKGSITVLAPKNGATLKSGDDIKLRYNVHLSPNGNHLHVYIDDQSPIIDRKVHHCPCSITLPDLAAGKHTVAVKEATVHHVLTGLEKTITFRVK